MARARPRCSTSSRDSSSRARAASSSTGQSIAGLPPHAVARRGISRSFQRTNLFPRLTVIENLRLAAARRRARQLQSPRPGRRAPGAQLERAARRRTRSDLAGRLGDAAGSLSYGEQRQLEVGVALATRPALLLLDEPTAGMSPEETERMTRMLEGLPREVTLLIIEHDMDVVASLADRVTRTALWGGADRGHVRRGQGRSARLRRLPGRGVMPGLAVDGIHTYYEDSHVLHGVSIDVAPGEAVALLGRNGAGKTTVIRSIVGFTPPRAGRVICEDAAIAGVAALPHRAAGDRAGAAGPANLRAALRAREPDARRARRRLVARARLRPVPAPARARRRRRGARCRAASSRCSPSAGRS